MADLEDEKLMAAVRQQIEIKVDPLSTLEQCREGIRVVGERFEKGDYYISDLIMSAELLNNVIEILGPTLTKNQNNKSAGKVVFGTVKGDIHNIGKDIVISLLKADGYEVYDMGINVPKETFIEKLKETGASVLGLSGLIPVDYDEMKATIEAIEKEGLRNQLKS
jgi:methanogenic corrinoid protein MtbC1